MILARDYALRVNRDIFKEKDEDFQRGLERELDRLQQNSREDSTQLVDALAACREAIISPHIELDSVGIIHVTSAPHVTPALS
jgi:hypothetical protein